MSEPKSKHPLSDGLYVTTQALPGYEEEVPAGVLVLFEGFSIHSWPTLKLTERQEDNRWRFGERAFPILEEVYLTSLEVRKEEGYYVLMQGLHLHEDTVIPERTLILLGYTSTGKPLIFIGKFTGNSITFPEIGYKFTTALLQILESVVFRQPPPPRIAQHFH